VNDMGGYDEILVKYTGEQPPRPATIELVHYDEMQARLGDGYLVKQLLGSGSMAIVYGESGTGKTFFALDLGLSIAAGTKFFGRRVRRAGVVYIAAEAGRGIENRVEAHKREIGGPVDMPFAAIVAPVNLCATNGDIDKLIAVVTAADIGRTVELIIIDTLSRVMAGGNENQPDDMGAFVRNVDRLRAETGAAVVVVHHSGKDASRGARGHSLLRAATDTEIEVTRDETAKVSTARVTKQREYLTEGSLSFTLKAVDLGFDQDGDPVGSCVVEVTITESENHAPNKRLPDSARIALSILQKTISEAGAVPPASNHIPAGTPTVDVEMWRRFYYAGTAADGQTQDARKKTFQRVRQQLQAVGAIGLHVEQCWVVSKA
jgi:archaellum biogenesis ATPase FlaH